MSYEVLPPSADLLRINDIIKNPDAKLACPGYPNIIGYVKAAASGETAYAEIGDGLFWKLTEDTATLWYPVYGGGCNRREYGCVITKDGEIVYDGLRAENEPCPEPTDNFIEGVIASYKIIYPGSGFQSGDYVMDTNPTYSNAVWKVQSTFTYQDGVAIAGDGISALILQEGGEAYSVGDVININLDPEDTSGRNPTDAQIQVTRVQTVYFQQATTIGTLYLSGEQAPTDGSTQTYTVTKTGDASPTYVLTSSDANDTVVGLDVTYSGAGTRTLTVTATDATASDSPATATLAINATAVFATRVANADLSVAVTVADTGNGNKYQIDGVEQDSISATAGQTIHFDLSDASLSGHPFGIYTDSSKSTQVTVGIEQEGDDLLFTPPIAGTFSYQCGAHAEMGGTITIS